MKLSLCCAAVVLALAGCKQSGSAVASAGAALTESPDTVVATYGGGKKVTLKDVDAAVGPQLRQLEKERLKLRKQAIDQVVVEAYATEEGAKAGQSKEQFIQAQIAKFATKPSEEELMAFFAKVQGRLPPGSTFDSVKGQLEEMVSRQKSQEAIGKMVEEIRTKLQVEVKMAEPRVTVAATGPSTGPSDAKITIIEYSDFECPYCSRAESTVEQVMTAYAGKVRLVFRHFPLSMHPNAPKAAEASLCAHEQGKFTEYKKVLFDNQDKLGVEFLKRHAKEMNLDQSKFDQCLDSGAMKAKVEVDMKDANDIGINGTPSFFVNGIQVDPDFAEFERVIKQELAMAK
jgi:protein-disulfide isomerase